MSLTRLLGLKVSKLDLVPDGDNPMARAVLWKARKAAPMVDCPKCGKSMPEGGTCPECGYTAKARPAPIAKADGNPPTCGELLDAREASDELQKLNWAFQDSMYGILWSGASNKADLLKASVEEFGARLKEITGEIDSGTSSTMKAIPTEDLEKFVERASALSAAAIEKAREKSMKLDINAIPEAQRGAVSELQKAHDTLTGQVATLTAEVTKLKATPPAADDDLAGVPEVTKARILKERVEAKATAERVEKLEETNAINARVAKVRTDHPALKDTTPDAFGAMLYRFEKGAGTAEARAADVLELERIVKALTEKAKLGKITTELGTKPTEGDDASADPGAEVKKRAEALVANKTFNNVAKAMEHVLASDSELRARMNAAN